MHSPQTSAAVAKRPANIRSRIGNGSALFADDTVDGRSKEARRFRDVLAEIVNDLGGSELLSEGQRQLARRCALMAVECERLEAEAVGGKTIDLDAYGVLTDRMGRAFSRLGLKRVAKAIPNPLADHFARPYRPEASAA